MSIKLICAVSTNNVIGNNNKLPWSISEDLKRFRELTSENIIVMGRKTYDSIGRPLPNRLNFVVSTSVNKIEGATVFQSTQESIDAAKQKCLEDHNYNEIVIIGGGYLFRETLEIANKLVFTKVDCEIEGDVYYPDVNLDEWVEKSSRYFSKDSENDYDFVVKEYERYYEEDDEFI